MIKVLVVDDHPFVRDAVDDLFAATGDIRVVDGCADGSEVLAAFRRNRPDVVLMDLTMPRVDGLQASRSLLQAFPDAIILLHTGLITAAQIEQAVSIGVKGYVSKGDDPSRLLEAVRKAAAGGTALRPPRTGPVDALPRRDVWGMPGSISLRREPGGLVLCLAGEIDQAVTREFEAEHGPPVPVHAIDAGAVTVISADGLTLIAAWAQASTAAGRRAVLRESTPWLDRVLQLAGLDAELTREGPATG